MLDCGITISAMGKKKQPKRLEDIFKEFLEEIEKSFTVDIQEDEAVFPIEVACKLSALNYWTLRSVIKEGIISPKKVGKKKMLFSEKDIKKIECVKFLMEEKGVNIKGIKMFFEISNEEE